LMWNLRILVGNRKTNALTVIAISWRLDLIYRVLLLLGGFLRI